MKTCKIF